jgi:hypothetical protein
LSKPVANRLLTVTSETPSSLAAPDIENSMFPTVSVAVLVMVLAISPYSSSFRGQISW